MEVAGCQESCPGPINVAEVDALKKRNLTTVKREVEAFCSFLLYLSCFLTASLHHVEGLFTNIASAFEQPALYQL